MSLLKRYKKYFAKQKWAYQLSILFFKDKDFRELFLNYKTKPSSLIRLENLLRKLLRLNPLWIKGHFILAKVSLALYENTKNNFYKGAIRLSSEAITELNGSIALKSLSKAMHLFSNNNLEEVIENILPKLELGTYKEKREQAIACEFLGGSYMIVGERSEAKYFFEKIEPDFRSSEINELIKCLDFK